MKKLPGTIVRVTTAAAMMYHFGLDGFFIYLAIMFCDLANMMDKGK